MLKALGFKPQFYERPIDASFKQFKEQLRNQLHLVHPEKIAEELHWKLFHFLTLKDAAIDELIDNNLGKLEFAVQTFKVLNAEMNLLYLLIHDVYILGDA